MDAAWPLGVDMLEWKKAKSFFDAHRGNLDRFLCSTEASFVLSSPKPHESLALILSAKEAVFKSLGRPWMGPSGFQDIQIIPGEPHFSFRLTGQFRKKFPKRVPSGISFVKNRRHVVATCHPCLPAGTRTPDLSCAGT